MSRAFEPATRPPLVAPSDGGFIEMPATSATTVRPAGVGGAWWPGDHPGQRQFVTLQLEQPLELEGQSSLGPVTVAYETWGSPSPTRDNAVLIEHALTGDSHAAGAAGVGHLSPGWWDALIGPGRPSIRIDGG